jgi:hypothetical protein
MSLLMLLIIALRLSFETATYDLLEHMCQQVSDTNARAS